MEKWNTYSRKGWMVAGILILFLLISGCGNAPEYEKYETEFIGTFDVRVQIIGYSESEKEFTAQCKIIYDKMKELNSFFDIYNDYEGIANLKTINDNAGIEPVEVDSEIIDLLLFSKEAYEKTDGLINIAMGAVLKIWHEYRTVGIQSPEDARLPSEEELKEAAGHTDIGDVIIDEGNSTVYLADPLMRLDVGAIAKGYAAQLAKDAAALAGFSSAIINAGGNIIVVGEPKDGVRERWGVGIQDPKKMADGVANVLDTVYLNDKAVVSSGNYERFYQVDGKRYHHIIDPKTLYPAEHFASISIIHGNSGVADYLSTAIFIAPYEKGLEIAKAHGAEVLWVYQDGQMEATEGYQGISKMYSGYSSN